MALNVEIEIFLEMSQKRMRFHEFVSYCLLKSILLVFVLVGMEIVVHLLLQVVSWILNALGLYQPFQTTPMVQLVGKFLAVSVEIPCFIASLSILDK